jgi:site-specific DNA recombinase
LHRRPIAPLSLVYIGEAVHKGVSYPGEHQAIIDRKLWDQVHAILKHSPRKRAANTRAQTPALLKGLLFGPDGSAMSPTHTRKKGRLYRYYISQSVMKRGTEACPIKQVPSAEIERIGIHGVAPAGVTTCLRPPWWHELRRQSNGLRKLPSTDEFQWLRRSYTSGRPSYP